MVYSGKVLFDEDVLVVARSLPRDGCMVEDHGAPEAG